MKKFYTILILLCFTLTIMAQDKVNIEVPYTTSVPVIDGIEDIIWNKANGDSIVKKFQAEEPTVTAYWKAMWSDDALYVLVSVQDDDHYPAYAAAGNWWDYDQTELYFDVNEDLNDGLGPNGKSGHYQVQPNFSDGGSGEVGTLTSSDYRPGGTYCYVVDGENYVFEYALDYTSFKNGDGTTLSSEAFDALPFIGFDVTIIDQDEGITTERQRAVWQNTGDQDESYLNMDDCGTITLVEELTVESIPTQKTSSLSVYPNPVSDVLVVNAEFDKLIITNILGMKVSEIVTSDKNISLGFLPSEIYYIQAFNRENLIGTTKIHKL